MLTDREIRQFLLDIVKERTSLLFDTMFVNNLTRLNTLVVGVNQRQIDIVRNWVELDLEPDLRKDWEQEKADKDKESPTNKAETREEKLDLLLKVRQAAQAIVNAKDEKESQAALEQHADVLRSWLKDQGLTDQDD